MPDQRKKNVEEEFSRLWRLKRYLSPSLVRRIIEAEDDKPFGMVAERKRVSFMFLDIRNFTEMSDELEPEIITDVLNEYYSAIDDIISRHAGSINKFLGDGLLVIFGEPIPNKEHKLSAIKAAIEIREAVRKYSAQVTFLPVPFKIGIGINSGKAVLGAFGPKNHVDYTAIGSAVNIAARLQALAKNDEIVVCSTTYEGLEDQIELSNEREVTVKGVANSLRVSDVLRVRPGKT